MIDPRELRGVASEAALDVPRCHAKGCPMPVELFAVVVVTPPRESTPTPDTLAGRWYLPQRAYCRDCADALTVEDVVGPLVWANMAQAMQRAGCARPRIGDARLEILTPREVELQVERVAREGQHVVMVPRPRAAAAGA